MTNHTLNVGDWVVLSQSCTPIAWRGRLAKLVPRVEGGFRYRVTHGVEEMGMLPSEIERLAEPHEILEYKLTL